VYYHYSNTFRKRVRKAVTNTVINKVEWKGDHQDTVK
jgi:hypothetical protein